MEMPLHIAIIGRGQVGAELLAQAHAKLNVIAITTSQNMILGDALTPSALLNSAMDMQLLLTHAQKYTPCCVMVDCTSSLAIAEMYPKWLELGLHIVTPNKKGFSSSMHLYNEIMHISHHTSGKSLIRYEATVGAGLPVINTLQDLIMTGDDIYKIEGIFSGTLSYLFNTFSNATSQSTFSEIIIEAKRLGYTEPDPRDDLNGIDVARKVTILARECGMQVSLDSLSLLENIVPEPLRELELGEFMHRLVDYDEHFDKLKTDAASLGNVLRYVGVVEVAARKCTVELKSYPLLHPFASLKGSDNIIAFHTARFQPQPLIIQGPGAGKQVTAFGIYADLLRIGRCIPE